MPEENQIEPGQSPVTPPDPTLLPPSGYEPAGQPPAWMPAAPPAAQPSSVWSRVAAYAVLIAIVAAVAGAGIGFSLARAIGNNNVAQSTTQSPSPITPVTPASPITPASPGTGGSDATISAIAAKVTPTIVDINTVLGNGRAAGTGMIISPTGEILTNNHVVLGSTSITVTVQGRSQTYSAHVVGVNISQDVAVIQIDGSVSGLPTVSFANSSSLSVGDTVFALGNALGQGGAPHVTQGQVTAVDQTITASEGAGSSETLSGMIASDAVIYQGDSGGALVNAAGQVVGMITAGEAQGFRSSASETGYAIASNTAVGIANRIRAHEQAADLTYGMVGFLGVSVQTVDSASGAQLGLNVTSGALVTQVSSGTPAASAGITRGSVITKVGGTTVTSSDSLGAAVKSHKPGDSVAITWVNTSGSHTANATLAGVNP